MNDMEKRMIILAIKYLDIAKESEYRYKSDDKLDIVKDILLTILGENDGSEVD